MLNVIGAMHAILLKGCGLLCSILNRMIMFLRRERAIPCENLLNWPLQKSELLFNGRGPARKNAGFVKTPNALWCAWIRGTFGLRKFKCYWEMLPKHAPSWVGSTGLAFERLCVK